VLKGGRLQFNFFKADEDKYKNLAGFKYHDEFIDREHEHENNRAKRTGQDLVSKVQVASIPSLPPV